MVKYIMKICAVFICGAVKEGECTMMKKTFIGSRLLAVVLTLAMVLSFAGVLPLGITASAADPSFDGYIYNGDFETGTASPWKLNS